MFETLYHQRVFKWIGRKRGEVTCAIAALSLADIVWGHAQPVDLLRPGLSNLGLLYWVMLLLGVALRIWAAGNLHKNAEITMRGVYQMVRHPPYLGTLLIYLAYFLAFGDDMVGLGLFLAVILLVYWPRLLHEEETLAKRFPSQGTCYRHIPRLLPNPFRLPAAWNSSRFSLSKAYRNLGVRSIGAVVLVPALLKALIYLKGR
jgi:isoprenylcysteine carboxyl methyltransferase (ICMT) family protein YpbQ